MNKIRKSLKVHAESVHNTKVKWGENDCTAWVLTWVRQILEKEIVAPTYSSRDEALAIIEEFGGLDQVWSGVLSKIGIYEINQPLLTDFFMNVGDICVFDTKRFGLCGGIYCGGGVVAWRSETSVHFLQPKLVVSGWKLPI